MNNKGQSQIGVLLTLAIVLIVGVVLFQASAQEIGNAVNTVELVNSTLATTVNGTSQFIVNFRALSSVVIINETNGTAGFTDEAGVIGSGNFTVTNNAIDPTTGGLAINITPDATAGFEGAWRVSGTAQPSTFIADSGGRALANIILLLFAVALAVISIVPTARQKLLDM